MSISTTDLYKAKESKYSATQSSVFESHFFYAMARTVEVLNSSRVGLGITETPEDLETDLDVDAKYYGVVCDLIDLYLQDCGQWGSEDKMTLMADAERSIARAHTWVVEDAAADTTVRLGS